MTARALTAAQVATLRELAKDGAKATLARPETASDYWWLSTNYEKCTVQIAALEKMGFVERERVVNFLRTGANFYATITPAGRAYLAALDADAKGAG